MTSLLTQVISTHGWSCPSVSGFVLSLPTPPPPSFSLNDPASHATQGFPCLNIGTSLTPSQGTANFDNIRQRHIEIGTYEALVQSLPPPYGKSCDYILFTQDCSHFVFAELKVFKSRKNKNPRAQLRQSLRDVWSTASSRFSNCPNKWCCLFKRIPVTVNTAPSITAVSAFNSMNTLTAVSQSGIKTADADMNASSFEFWVFTNDQRCQLN